MAPKCPICRLGAEGCQCPSICKKCLSGGILEAQGECQCCRICKNSLDECVCCKNCKRLPQTCNCSLSQATVPLAQSQSQAFTSIASVRPPDLGLVKVKGNLPIYIASLRRWSRIGGVKAELQGDVVMMHASSDFPELYLELETELGEKILNNTDAIKLIIEALEKRYGVNKQADLMNTFNKFIGTSRRSNLDLVSYVAAFDNASRN